MVVASGGLVSSWAMSLYAGRSSELGFVYRVLMRYIGPQMENYPQCAPIFLRVPESGFG